jgi:hypothetical protein
MNRSGREEGGRGMAVVASMEGSGGEGNRARGFQALRAGFQASEGRGAEPCTFVCVDVYNSIL